MIRGGQAILIDQQQQTSAAVSLRRNDERRNCGQRRAARAEYLVWEIGLRIVDPQVAGARGRLQLGDGSESEVAACI